MGARALLGAHDAARGIDVGSCAASCVGSAARADVARAARRLGAGCWQRGARALVANGVARHYESAGGVGDSRGRVVGLAYSVAVSSGAGSRVGAHAATSELLP